MNKSYDVVTMPVAYGGTGPSGSNSGSCSSKNLKSHRIAQKYLKQNAPLQVFYGAQLNNSTMKSAEIMDSFDQSQLGGAQQPLRPFRNWDTIEKEKEATSARDGILAHLRKIGLVPQGRGEDLKPEFFEAMFTELIEEERRLQGVEEAAMGTEQFVTCLVKYFEQISAEQNLLKIVCESVIASWVKAQKKGVKGKGQGSGLNGGGLVLKSKKVNNKSNMSKSIMTTLGKPANSGKSTMSSGNNNSASQQNKISQKFDKIINPSSKRMVCKPPKKQIN